MKKILSLVIIGIMVFSLTACGNRNEDNTTRQEASGRQEISEKETNPAAAEGTESSDRTEKEEMDTNSDSKAAGNIR